MFPRSALHMLFFPSRRTSTQPCRTLNLRPLAQCWRVSVFLAIAFMPCLRAEDAPPAETNEQELHSCAEGPWGRLSYYYYYLEAPDYVVAQFPLPGTITKWVFNIEDFDRVEPLLKNAGMAAERVEQLLIPRRVVRDSRHVFLFPSPADLENLSLEARSVIYAELGRNPANVFHYSPVFFLADSVQEWAKESGLSEEIVTRIEALAYRSGDALVFSDIPLLLSHAETVAEARLIMQKLTRVRTLMAQLELSKEDSIPDLLNYWSTGLQLRRKEMEPLMNAVVRTKGLSHLDILHLLPSLPRKLLYTYPDMSYATEGRMPDCHWTTLNFFNIRPQQFLLDTRLATSLVKQDFDKVEPPYRYGDVLMFIEPDGKAVHSATYLADDIMFTKNGSNILAPWLLMRLQDLAKLYNVSPGKTRIEGFRHKK
jgi:hypothetical protein